MTDNTEAFIEYSWKKQEQITDNIDLYAWESIKVREWSISLEDTWKEKITLNKVAELKFNSDNNYSFFSSKAWIESNSDDINISMRYANIALEKNSVVSLNQNDASSTIYLLSGNADVTNLGWQSTPLSPGEKISISRINASSEDLDISSSKEKIDSFFKSSDWFLDNNGHLILQANPQTPLTESGSQDTTQQVWGLISFSNISDEMSTSLGNIDIQGTILSEKVEMLTINNKQASINNKNFSLADVPLRSGINDVVVKVFSEDKDILEKRVYTIYSSSSANGSQDTSLTPTNTSNSKVTTYKVNANDFGFTAPSNTGKYTTPYGEVTIRGYTKAKGIESVKVNGFKLSSFKGSTWRYHAFERFETLEEGTNQYRIDYIGGDGNIVYTDYFTIVKQANNLKESTTSNTGNEATKELPSKEKTVSWEATTQ